MVPTEKDDICYTVVPCDEEAITLDQGLHYPLLLHTPSLRSRVQAWLPWLVHLILLSTSLFLFIASQTPIYGPQSLGDTSLFSQLSRHYSFLFACPSAYL